MSKKVDKAPPVSYIGHSFQLEETASFASWLDNLRDRRARARVIDRLRRASNGNFGDHKSVGSGVFEMKVVYGPGYRVYYFQRGEKLFILLCGGDKSTQNADIARAKQFKEEIERSNGDTPV